MYEIWRIYWHDSEAYPEPNEEGRLEVTYYSPSPAVDADGVSHYYSHDEAVKTAWALNLMTCEYVYFIRQHTED